ncbi:hypothetical protein FACS189490_00030 [Clostridia bacterium]|nr:hypothetical protein FACS189490_00030 [Clostridia bacterium]
MKLKKLVTMAAITASLVMSSTSAAFASYGYEPDPYAPIGQYYKTDIKAYVSDAPTASYNVGGRTLICIEDIYLNTVSAQNGTRKKELSARFGKQEKR